MADEANVAEVEQTSSKSTEDIVLPEGESYAMASLTFWDNIGVKIVETITSIKVLGLATMTSLSTYLLVHGHIDGGQWTTTNTAIYGLIFGMREAFKLSQIYQQVKTKVTGKKITV